MAHKPSHHTTRRYRPGVGWWAACTRCPWRSEPGPVWEEARGSGRVHELYPQGIDWSRAEAWR